MTIAIVGTGVSGLVCGWMLHRDHDVTLFEANDYVGGHTHTVPVELAGRRFDVDTGFLVYNERTYPAFTEILRRLGVATQATEMSFSVRSDADDLEYNGSSLNSLFAQRRNLVRPSFLRMVRSSLFAASGNDIREFCRRVREEPSGDLCNAPYPRGRSGRRGIVEQRRPGGPQCCAGGDRGIHGHFALVAHV
jgi:predicted NAD/FAD-binding protein